MAAANASKALVAHLAVLSLVSFGGIPAALPDLHDFVVSNRWVTDQYFANCFAVVQAIPGPNMILLTSLIGWQIGGLPVAIASGVATFGPSCVITLIGFRVWNRYHHTGWHAVARRGLAPVTIGLILAAGFVMAQTGNAGWRSAAVTIAAAALTLGTRWNPLVLIAGAGLLGGCGLL